MLKILGLLCVVGSASAVGFGFAAGVRRQAEQLRALQTALGQMKSETAYRMTPLPELLSQVGADTDGAVGTLISRCALELRRRTSTVQFAMQTALSHTPGLSLPQSARRALLALSGALVYGAGDRRDLTVIWKLISFSRSPPWASSFRSSTRCLSAPGAVSRRR